MTGPLRWQGWREISNIIYFVLSECKLAKSLDSNLTLSIKSEHAQTLAVAILLLGFFQQKCFWQGIVTHASYWGG